MLSICLLVSGQLGYKILKELQQTNYKIIAVFTDSKSVQIIEHCKERNISCFKGNPRNGRATEFIKAIECDVLLSVNYLFLIEADIIQLPKLHAINLHGSLLPRYRGRSPHVWAIINGETETGITAHLMDEKVDNGDIVRQLRIPIRPHDTGGIILEKFNHFYPGLVRDVLMDIEGKGLKTKSQDITKATYFGKRTPDDGEINWDWSRQRIQDWIRAQARPYPGAFGYFNNQKFTIHSSKIADLGFNYELPNGTILSVEEDSIIVKTTNGALRLKDIEGVTINEFKEGTQLNTKQLELIENY